MLSLEDLKADPALVARIDWHITPQEAFETYQLKSPGNWRGGNLPPVVYFYISTWKGPAPRLYLVERSLKHSEELSSLSSPSSLLPSSSSSPSFSLFPPFPSSLSSPFLPWLPARLRACGAFHLIIFLKKC